MSTEWYCVIGGERRGPMAWEALADLARRGELGPEDLVWEQAFGAEWRAAQTVDKLVEVAAAAAAAAPVPPSLTAGQPEPDAPRTPLTGVAGTRPRFSVAVDEAWDGMKRMLFAPFDLARWFSLGFCAWIAAIGSGGCNGASFPDKNVIKSWQKDPEAGAGTLLNEVQSQYRTFMDAHPGMTAMIVVAALTALVLVVAWMLVATWLRSRGAFMLVHRWHHPDDTVSQSWAVGRGLGRSLFLWRVTFGSLMFLLLAGMAGALLITVGVPFFNAKVLPPGGLPWLVGLGGALLLLMLSWGTVGLMLDAFVVPVMYWRRVGVLDAWRVVLAFCNEQPLAVLIYLLLWPWLVLAGMLAFGLLALCSCCLLCIPLMLPYVNQVAMLPLTLLFRGVGIRFLKQWRPDL